MRYALSAGVVCGGAAAAALWRRYARANDRVRQFANATHDQLADIGAVDRLTVQPLVEREAVRPDLRTEVGVSYLLTLDDGPRTSRVLFDLGRNRTESTRSALLDNARALGVDLTAIDAVVVSHAHDDHVGGRRALRRGAPAIAAGAPVEPPGAPLLTPVAMRHDLLDPVVTTGPRVVAAGLALLPPAPATLFWEGVVVEQSLAVNVRGHGLVLVTGCGHPGTAVLLDLAARVLDTGVHSIVGGLHLPVHGYPGIRVAGSPRPPWDLLDETDVDDALGAVRTAGVVRVALSPHDSTPWTRARFAAALGDAAEVCRVGAPIVVGDPPP